MNRLRHYIILPYSIFGTILALAGIVPGPAFGHQDTNVAEPTTILAEPVPVPAAGQPLPAVSEVKVKKTVRLTVTAYSSTVDQTDGDPFTTASGARVRDGIIAHNGLPFGTHVRFPEVFGDRIFEVQDRLHPSKGYYIADLWMHTREEAKEWGAQVVTMEILES